MARAKNNRINNNSLTKKFIFRPFIPALYYTYFKRIFINPLSLSEFKRTTGILNAIISHHMKFRLFLAVFVLFLISCNEPNTLFERISSGHSGIHFTNQVTESDSINPLDMEFLYNGGGVAVGDFNRDGKQDLYFTASQVANKLYLNKGNFEFSDVTDEARVGGEGRWCNAASVVDINNDGWQDIYVCASIKTNTAERTNLFYINQGVNKQGTPFFKEMAQAYGLADTGFSVHATFFDYDRDNDLDMYLLTTTLAQRNSTRFDGGSKEHKQALSDQLFRNEGSDSLGHPYFKNVSKEAGIYDEGYGLGIAIADVNKDGWKDIYVCNDFFTSDLLYLNNGDGTFSDKARASFKHTSQNAMGNDIADINNDGWPDIIAVDMDPEDNHRKKKNLNPANYYVHQSMLNGEALLQYVRNTLQLNNGTITDSTNKSIPLFSDISFYAGVAETDWSWNPSLADFDNDGLKDLIITNGYPRDVTDHDFAVFRAELGNIASKEDLLEQIPMIKVPNYAFKNRDGLKFDNVTKDWGMDISSFSDGAAYVDLDNDGDLDYVINNINDEAFVFKNTLKKTNYLNIQFDGNALNRDGIGATVEIFHNKVKQVFENSPYRGYLSTVDHSLHFGLGADISVDSVLVTWPDGKQQLLQNIKANQTLVVHYKNAVTKEKGEQNVQPLFANTTKSNNITYRHTEFDFEDFDIQKLLPYKFSSFGPSIAAGDVDQNGYDDLFIGASTGFRGQFLLQQSNGKFIQKELPDFTTSGQASPEMMGVLLFDADSDGDLDLYSASGSYEYAANSKVYQDCFFLNNGKGLYVYDSTAIPQEYTSKSCVKAADFDKDGDLDLFVGGRIHPGRYPEPVNSFIYRNDSKDGRVKFTNVTSQVAPFLQKAGLICDAIWTDIDNDGWQDLAIAGEWMPLRFLKNTKGKFSDISTTTGIQQMVGWWNSITAGDFDNDGDIDYIAGNLGLNSFFKASDNEPVSVYGSDFNNDKAYDAVPSLFLPDENGNRKEYPAHGRDEMIKQIVGVRKKFNSYKSYANATITDLLPADTLKKALHLKANFFASCFVENKGNGKFAVKPLPFQAQLAPLNGMITQDVNNDGNLDVIISGNHYGNEIINGQYDAMNGLVLLGSGTGNFVAMTIQQSGFYVPGDAKGLVQLVAGKRYTIAATQNKNTLQTFAAAAESKIVRLNPDDIFATIYLKNGEKRKEEFYYGTSFLSQSARFLIINPSIKNIEIVNTKGEKRTLQ